MNDTLFTKLIEPIPGDELCGQDMSFSPEFDEIREARREDDPTLNQGEWKVELKVGQWLKVKKICEEILQFKSKDLQVACWYTEALTKLYGFAGLIFGLRVLEVLITDFWEFAYPPFVSDDLEERAGKLIWFNTTLALTVRHIPITERTFGAYSWLKWSESREMDNLGLKNAEAKMIAIASGKLSSEMFDKAATSTGLQFYQALHAQCLSAVAAVASIEKHVDSRFEKESPGLQDLRLAVGDCADVVEKILLKLGGQEEKTTARRPPKNTDNAPAPRFFSGQAAPSLHSEIGQFQNRIDAISMLREVGSYFRQNEPHSPVALLVDRAAKWAEMPFEVWLESVIKDGATLTQLRELLDLRRG